MTVKHICLFRYYLTGIFLGFVFCPGMLHAQKTTQVEIVNSDIFEGDESLGKNVSRLTGNVSFRHHGALMFCDSAYLYQETNSLDAFGRIRIVQGDTISLTGDLLKYDGNTRQAKLTGNVIMNDKEMQLKSRILNYNLGTETAEYFDGGEITDPGNTLVSRSGYYYSKDRMVFFRDSVRLVNAKYKIASDTLKYRTDTRVAIFEGPTRIYSSGNDSSVIYCTSGWYNTETEKSFFNRRPLIVAKEKKLESDSINYDNKLLIGKAYGNVSLTDTIQKIEVAGDFGISDDRRKTALVTGHALLVKAFTGDSLFLHADTLNAKEDTLTGNKTWSAFHGVKIFKPDLQGVCDSLVYSDADSTISFFRNPVLWNEENQLTADFMTMKTGDGSIRELNLYESSFITSKEDSIRFNQIKGRNMTGYFDDNKLNAIRVEGNGQSVYYTRNNKKQFTGVNRADCSDMLIRVQESKINTITLINQPDATLYPIEELSPGELRLKGFTWLKEKRPSDKESIFKK